MAQEVKTSEKKSAPTPTTEEGFWVGSTELRKEFDRLFDTLLQPSSWFPNKGEGSGFRPPWTWGSFPGSFTPAVDLIEKDDEFLISAEIPGVEAQDLSVDISGDMITIKGEKSQSTEQKEKNYHIQERHHGVFQRSFPLPRGVNSDKITASFDKGVLSISLPKAKTSGTDPKKVTITTP